MAEQRTPTCNSPGPQGLRCFELKGHAGKHRTAQVYEWNTFPFDPEAGQPPEASTAPNEQDSNAAKESE